MPLYDAHNHLQDERLASERPGILRQWREIGLAKCVCNGTRLEDWPKVAELARTNPEVLPSFGLHPWHVKGASANWQSELRDFLARYPFAIGEIGLDRWIKDYDWEAQLEAVEYQLKLAAELNLPVTIHCLRAWGPLLDALKKFNPPRGFLLHSYGGPVEMVTSFLDLGAYFSISGYFAHPRKSTACEVFKRVPLNRLLIETDAPDMAGPEGLLEFPLSSAKVNHPANIRAVYRFCAELRGMQLADLALQVAANFKTLFRPG